MSLTIKRRIAIIITLSLSFTALFSTHSASKTSQPSISWFEKSVEVTLPIGGTQVRSVTLTSNQTLHNVTVEPVPEIARFLSVQPSSDFSLSAGQQESIQLSFSIPDEASPGTYEGTIHIRSNKRTIPATLKIVIHVQQQVSAAEYILFSNPGDPLLLKATTATGDVVEYFGEKDENGLATFFKSVTVRGVDGQVTRVLLDNQSRPTQIVAPNGVVLQINWLSTTNILVSAVSPDGSVQVNVAIDLTQVPPPSLLSAAHSTTKLLPTANSPINRIRGAGKPLQATVSSKESANIQSLVAGTISNSSTNTSLVNVMRCGEPVNNADVAMTVIPPSADAYTIPGTLVGAGQYSVTIPTMPSSGQPAEDLCRSVASVLGKGCDALQVLPLGSEIYICLQLAAAISLIGTPAAGAAILAVCETSFLIGRLYCDTLGYSGPVPGGESIAERLCGNVSEIVDRFTGGDLFIFPLVFIPGEGFVDTGAIGQSAPSSGPFPSFNINAGSNVVIESFTTTPSDPAPFQSYIAEALITCAPPGTLVTISISGTDGYFDSTSVTISGDANVTLAVPGAEAAVVDTVTVQVSGGPTRQIVLVF